MRRAAFVALDALDGLDRDVRLEGEAFAGEAYPFTGSLHRMGLWRDRGIAGNVLHMGSHDRDIIRTEQEVDLSVPAKMLHFGELRARFERQMADYLADVGRRLREARLRNRPDLDSIPKAARAFETATGIHVSEKQYGRWERGESEPRGAKRDGLAAMLGIRKEEIWGEPPVAPEDELRAALAELRSGQKEILRQLAGLRSAIRLLTAAPSRQPTARTPGQRSPGKAAAGK